MTFEQFDKFQDALLKEVMKMRDTKGREYANDADRFANFKRLAVELNIDPIDVAWIFATKHLDSIRHAIKMKTFTALSEPLNGRFVDFICYLTLIAGIIEERMQDADKAALKSPNQNLLNQLAGMKGVPNEMRQMPATDSQPAEINRNYDKREWR
jgi:hypothetical protein